MDGWMDMCARVCVCVCVCVHARACVCVCAVCLRVQKIQARENREMHEMTMAISITPSQQYCRQSSGLKLEHCRPREGERERHHNNRI